MNKVIGRKFFGRAVERDNTHACEARKEFSIEPAAHVAVTH